MVLFSLLFTLATPADAGPPAGVGPKNIQFAWSYLDRFIEGCLSQPSCDLTQPEEALLRAVARDFLQSKAQTRLELWLFMVTPAFRSSLTT